MERSWERGRKGGRRAVLETDIRAVDGKLVVALGVRARPRNIKSGDKSCGEERREGLLEDVDCAS